MTIILRQVTSAEDYCSRVQVPPVQSGAGATGRGQKGSPAITTIRQAKATSAYSTRQATSAYSSRWYSDAGATGRGQEGSTTTIKPQAEVS